MGLECEFSKNLMIWNRERTVNIMFDCYEEEEISEEQISAYEEFIENIEHNQKLAYQAFEKYCVENYSEDIPEDGFDNIYKYLLPDMIYVKRDYQDRKVIGFICRFKLDMENGLAVKFVDGAVEEVGPNQIVL